MNLDFVTKTRTGRQVRSATELSGRLDFLLSRLNSKTDPQIRSLIEVVERRLTSVTPPAEEPKAIVAVAEPVPVNDRPVFQEVRSIVKPSESAISYHQPLGLTLLTTLPSS